MSQKAEQAVVRKISTFVLKIDSVNGSKTFPLLTSLQYYKTLDEYRFGPKDWAVAMHMVLACSSFYPAHLL